jgi:hypothetical protein
VLCVVTQTFNTYNRIIMNNNYKSVAKIEVLSNPAFGVDIHVLLNRDLYPDEAVEVHDMTRKLINMIAENTMLHSEAYQKELVEQRRELLECFPEPIYVKEIPNEYNGGKLSPWYLVTTKKGVIKIGWRKRVIVIDWSDSDIVPKAEELFGSELVDNYKPTMSGKMIHAWGYDKANEYIHKLINL